MANVKVFVHATNMGANTYVRAMTLAPQTYLSRLANELPWNIYMTIYYSSYKILVQLFIAHVNDMIKSFNNTLQ